MRRISCIHVEFTRSMIQYTGGYLYSYEELKVKPNGVRILSCATLFAISPPRSSAIAPIMAYSEVLSTASCPEP